MSDAGRYVIFKQYLSLTNPGKEVHIEAPSSAIDYQYTLSVSPVEASIQAKGSTGETERITISPQSLKNSNTYTILALPDAPAGIAHRPYSRYNSKRSKNLLLPCPVDERYSYTIQLAEGMELSTPDCIKTVDNSVGKTVTSVKRNDSYIEVARTLEIEQQRISLRDYAAFRHLMTEWADPNNSQLLLRMKE
jgi:hypothetical protein